MTKDVKTKEELMQRKYLEYKMIEQQVKQMQEQLEKFETQSVELHNVKQYLGDLHTTPKGTEILVPLTNGIFVKTSLVDAETLLVNVGSNVAVKKTNNDTKAMVHEQIAEIEKYKLKLLENLSMLMAHAQHIEQELSSYAERTKS